MGPRLALAVLETFDDGKLPGTPEEFHRFEERLLAVARRDLVSQVAEEAVREVHRHEEFVVWGMADARRRGARLRVTRDREARIRLVGGEETTISTPYMAPIAPTGKPGPKPKQGQRGKGGAGLFPVLASLGFLGRVSPHVVSETARYASLLGSFDEAAGVLKRQGTQLHPDTVRMIAGRAADAGLAYRELADPIDEATFAGKRVVIAPDGGRVRLRFDKPGRRLKSGFHGYEAPWHEPKVFAAYAIDDKGNKVSDELPVYEGTLAPWKNAVALAARTLRRYGVHLAETVVIAADGSDNIWREVDDLVALAGIDPAKVVRVVDFCHAVGHLSDAAKLSSRFASDQQREQWLKKQKKRLKRGRIERILVDMEALPTSGEEAAKALVRECKYFRSRIPLLRYDEFRQQGLPVGTGAVESAIRRIVNLRMKNPGTFWKPENAERMLFLRCRAKSGRWHEVEAAIHRMALLPARDTHPAIFDEIAA